MGVLNHAHKSKSIIGIIGGHLNNTNIAAMGLAEKTGVKLAELGIAVATGGEDGIMEAVFRGAKKASGVTIAITKSNNKLEANQFSDFVIPTSLDLAFMNVLAWASDGVIAFDGRFGTMCEVGLILDIGKPLVLIGEHALIDTQKINVPYCLHLKDYDENNIQKSIDFITQFYKK